jgi:serine/threonine protein kinase
MLSCHGAAGKKGPSAELGRLTLERGVGDVVRRANNVSLNAAASGERNPAGLPHPRIIAWLVTMSLSPGTRLGPYEITALIGIGGMGEVYRATDTNLGRQVAIKVLPDAVASDAERLSRFDREAKTLAALNHPNITQIHGLEKSARTIAIVIELVERCFATAR